MIARRTMGGSKSERALIRVSMALSPFHTALRLDH
jgi:hypothetical protein